MSPPSLPGSLSNNPLSPILVHPLSASVWLKAETIYSMHKDCAPSLSSLCGCNMEHGQYLARQIKSGSGENKDPSFRSQWGTSLSNLGALANLQAFTENF